MAHTIAPLPRTVQGMIQPALGVANVTRPATELADKFDRLLAAVLRAGSQAPPRADAPAVHPVHVASATNLAHFVAMRSTDLRDMQDDLAALGLSSLGRSEAHVLATILAVRTALRSLVGEPAEPVEPVDLGVAPTFVQGRRLLVDKAAMLLGPEPVGRVTRIMVTLPSAAQEQPEMVQEFVDLGMDVARVNCAHDDVAAWEAMVHHVRVAAAASGREVRVLMDLGGPKLRTGPIRPGPAVVRVKPAARRVRARAGSG